MNRKDYCDFFYRGIEENINIDSYLNTLKYGEDKGEFIVAPTKFGKLVNTSTIGFFLYKIIIIFSPFFVFLLLFVDFFKFSLKVNRNGKVITNKICKTLVFLNEKSIIKTLDNNPDLLKDYLFLTSPKLGYVNEVKKESQVNILETIGFFEYFGIFLLSLKCVFYGLFKIEYRNSLYLSNCFEWLLVCHFFSKHKNFEVVFTNQKDRWVVLFDNLDVSKIIKVQHGTNILRFSTPLLNKFYQYISKSNTWALESIYKCKNVSTLICFGELECDHLLAGEFAEKPEEIIYIPYNLRVVSSKVKMENKVNLLLIGNPEMFFKEESVLLNRIDYSRFNVFVKNHPLSDDSFYKNFVNVILVKETIDNDIIISYQSTLAYEYEALGYEVLYYNQFNSIEDLYQGLIKKAL